MIQIIGILIALYVMTKMLHLVVDKSPKFPVVLMAAITLLFSVFAIYSLITTGNSISNNLLR